MVSHNRVTHSRSNETRERLQSTSFQRHVRLLRNAQVRGLGSPWTTAQTGWQTGAYQLRVSRPCSSWDLLIPDAFCLIRNQVDGGHTAEMLKLLSSMDHNKYNPRCYIVAETDRLSGVKALNAEQQWHAAESATGSSRPAAEVCTIPRSREVGQSYFTSVWTTLVALTAAFMLVWQQRPQLVLVNGPGTCIPICFSAWLFRVFARRPCRIVYVESIARVTELSLSAKILYRLHMSDALFVQWPPLQQRYPHTLHCGRLY